MGVAKCELCLYVADLCYLLSLMRTGATGIGLIEFPVFKEFKTRRGRSALVLLLLFSNLKSDASE